MSWFLDLFKKKQILEMPLEFHLMVDKNGYYHMKIFSNFDGNKTPETDYEKLSTYGYKIETDTAVYLLGVKDLQIIYSILSLNPQVTDSGDLFVDMTPTILSYLRNNRVNEDLASKSVQIKKKALLPYIHINGQLERGLNITFDYIDTDNTTQYKSEDLLSTKDPNYIRVKNIFYPNYKPRTEREQKVLSYNGIHIDSEDIPRFLREDLPLIKAVFPHTLDPRIQQVVINDKPLERIFSLKRVPDRGIDLKINYYDRTNGRYIPDNELVLAWNHSYDRVINQLFPKYVPRSEEESLLLKSNSNHISFDRIPEFLTKDLPIIKASFNTILDESVKRIRIINEPLNPFFSLDLEVDKLIFSVSYKIGNYSFSHQALLKDKQQFKYIDSDTWIIIDLKRLQSIDDGIQLLKRIQTIESKYYSQINQLSNIERFIASINGSKVITDELKQAFDTMKKDSSKKEIIFEAESPRSPLPSRFEDVTVGKSSVRLAGESQISILPVTYLIPNQISRQKWRDADGSKKYPRNLFLQGTFTKLSLASMQKTPNLTSPHVPLKAFFTTYKDMNQSQYEWYIRWRYEWLSGKPISTDLSYLSLCSYELLNFFIIPEVMKSYRALETLYYEFKDSCPQLELYIPGWLGDLAWELNLTNEAIEWWKLAPNDRDNIEMVRLSVGGIQDIKSIFSRYPYPPTAHTKKYPQETAALFETVAKDLEEYCRKNSGYSFEYLLGTTAGGHARRRQFYKGAMIARQVTIKPVKEITSSSNYSAWKNKAFIEFFNAVENLQRDQLSHMKHLLVEELYLDKILLKFINEELPKYAKPAKPDGHPVELDMALIDEISKEGEIFEKEIEMVDAGVVSDISIDNSSPSNVVIETISDKSPIEVEIIDSSQDKGLASATNPITSPNEVKVQAQMASNKNDFDLDLVNRLSIQDEALERDLDSISDGFEDNSAQPSSELLAPISELADAENGILSDKEKNFIKLVMKNGAYPVCEARKLAWKDGMMLDAFIEGLNEKGWKINGIPFVTKDNETIIFNSDLGQIDLDKGGIVWNQQEN